MEFITLRIDLDEKRVVLKPFEREGVLGVIDYGIYVHSEVYRSYSVSPYDGRNVLVFGRGPFSGSILPGSHRLTYFFRSPLYKVLFPSTMGGAAYTFMKTGIDIVEVTGKAGKPTVVVIRGSRGELNVSLYQMEEEKLFRVWRGYKGKEGVYALTEFLIEELADFFDGEEFRIACVGPASFNTDYGAIFSQTLRDGKPVKGSEDWAARGGSGSVMMRAHGLCGIAFGGSNEGKRFKGLDLSNYDHVKSLFSRVYSKPLFKVIAEKTEKYRYNPKLKTGGTFGGDYLAEKELTPVLNWQMPYIPVEKRKRLYEAIEKYYVDPFNGESIEKKSWTTCGEPCPATCKKVRNGLKVDYEPYNANGPLSGSLFLKASDLGVRKVDALGFDAIEFGGTAAWVFELIGKGLLKPEEVGLSDKPDLNPDSLLKNPVEVSKRNAELLSELAEKVAYGKGEIPKLLGKGKRNAAKILDKMFGERLKPGQRFSDCAVYVALGEDGEITPTMYWAMGNFIPLPVQGKYWTYYKFGVFPEPEELADRILESAVGEYWYDNVGWCRFHRRWMKSLSSVECELAEGGVCNLPVKWTKSVLELLFLKAYGEKVNAESHGMEQIRKLINYALKAGYSPIFPESERVKDLIAAGASEFGRKEWAERFKKNREKALREYVKRTLDRYSFITGTDWKI
ncbi:MAG: aldehyde ferredoxin oxidoreductase N-terminal domain-containing protein [Desulfurobacteriaceae bacterium]